VFAAVIALACASCANAAPRPVSPSIEVPAGSAVIYVARRGWHIDIGFDAADLSSPPSPLESLVSEFPAARHLFVGFGDQHYLLAKHQNGPVMLEALWPGPGMILATGLRASPGEAFGGGQVIALHVTRAQLQTAEDFVRKSLRAAGVTSPATADAGAIRPYARGPYEGSFYFSTQDRYSALHTCNTWAAELLKAAGLAVRSGGVIFASQLWRQVRRLEREQSLRAPRASRLRAPPTAVALIDIR